MPTDLETQVRDYADYLLSDVEPISVMEIREMIDRSHEISLTAASPWRIVPGWALAVIAAALVLVVGGVGWLASRNEPVEPTPTTIEPPTPTTDPQDDAVVPFSAMHRAISPGYWSVAATISGDATIELNDIARDVLTWNGVFEVAIASDPSTWQKLTGLQTCPVDGTANCGPGLVILVAEPWINQVALRLGSENGMSTVTSQEIPDDYWQGYVSAVTTGGSPEPTFDASSLGREIPLRRPAQLDENLEFLETFGPISMAVETEIEGHLVQAIVNSLPEDPSFRQVNGTWANTVSRGPGRAAYLDASDQSSIMVDLASFTEQDHPLGPRRVYYLAGLPLDVAVVATHLTDGTAVWQRPVDGMALIVDMEGSLPERFWPFFDHLGWTDLDDMDNAEEFVLYDADGTEIMRIEESGSRFWEENRMQGDRELIITDLRIGPLSAPPSESPAIASGAYEVTDTIQLDEKIPGRFWDEDVMVADGTSLWVATWNGLSRLDTSTLEVIERIPVNGGVWDLLVDEEVLWAIAHDNKVMRIDRQSGSVTDTFRPACAESGEDCETFARKDLLILDGWVWLVGPFGQSRIDRITLDVEVIPDLGGVEYHPNTDGGTNGVAVDKIGTIAAMWLGEANGMLWSLGSHDGHVLGLDLETGQRVDYEMHVLAGVDAHESWATLSGDDIWLVPCCDRKIVRFNTATREISTVDTSGGWVGALSASDGLWVAGRSHIDRIDIQSDTFTDTLVVDGLEPRGIIADGLGAIWVAGEDVVIRIDTTTRQITDLVPVASGGQLLSVGGGIWVAGWDGTISRIEAR